MKRITHLKGLGYLAFLFLLIFNSYRLYGQDAYIQLEIKNLKDYKLYIDENDYSKPERLLYLPSTPLSFENGKSSVKIKLEKPVFVNLYSESPSQEIGFDYLLYLEPGDSMNIKIDLEKPSKLYQVKGKGAANNQAEIQKLYLSYSNFEAYKNDSLPYQLENFIALKQKNAQNIFTTLQNKNKLSPSFIEATNVYLDYFNIIYYLENKNYASFNVGQKYQRNEQVWQKIEDSLLALNNINHEKILLHPYTTYFLPLYIEHKKSNVLRNPEKLNLYFDTTYDLNILYNTPDLCAEKIINKLFSSRIEEFLYANLITTSLNGKEENLPDIFKRFKLKFPTSQYVDFLNPYISKIEERNKQILTDEMVMIENSDSLNTLDDVLKLVKGKTVLLDMWGTWCVACRNDIVQHSDSLKRYFKNKDVQFLYIANYDMVYPDKWKKLIAFYHLTGLNILANDKLTNDIMSKVNRNGFPTYIIIKKDGTFYPSNAGYPLNREILISEINKALDE